VLLSLSSCLSKLSSVIIIDIMLVHCVVWLSFYCLVLLSLSSCLSKLSSVIIIVIMLVHCLVYLSFYCPVLLSLLPWLLTHTFNATYCMLNINLYQLHVTTYELRKKHNKLVDASPYEWYIWLIKNNMLSACFVSSGRNWHCNSRLWIVHNILSCAS